MAPISSIMHRHGFRILRYLDDWVVLGSSFRDLVWARDFLLWLCQEFGVQVNLEKSSLTPSQTLDYLGMRLQTLPLRVFPTPKRVLKLASLVSEFTSCHLQPLALWRQLMGGNVVSVVNRSRVSAPDEVSSAASELRRPSSSVLGQRFLGYLLPRESSVVVRRIPSSCRSSTGSLSSQPLAVHRRLGFRLGCLPGDDQVSSSWSHHCSSFLINHRKLLAVLYGVQGFLPLLRHRSVSLFANNTTALAYLRNQGDTHSSLLNSVAQAILRLYEVPQFIPGRLNWLADTLSRRSQVLGRNGPSVFQRSGTSCSCGRRLSTSLPLR